MQTKPYKVKYFDDGSQNVIWNINANEILNERENVIRNIDTNKILKDRIHKQNKSI